MSVMLVRLAVTSMLRVAKGGIPEFIWVFPDVTPSTEKNSFVTGNGIKSGQKYSIMFSVT